MANAREIKSRISSVQDTMKITNAMYMISSSKMKKAKKILSDTEPYFYNMQNAQPLGYLIMEGNVIQENNGAASEPYFAVLKDGTYAIRDAGTDCSDVLEAVSGPCYLVKDGQVNHNGDYLIPVNSIGLKADGTVVTFMADGRQSPYSVGMTMNEQAEFLAAQGVVNALFLDGGGSATYASKREGTSDLTIRNRPSDGVERTVSSALLLVSTAESDGVFDHASLSPNNTIYTPNSQIQFSAIGVDKNGGHAELPDNVSWSVTDSKCGTIDADGLFTPAKNYKGEVTAQLLVDGKSAGRTTVTIADITDLSFSSAEASLDFGASSDLGLIAKSFVVDGAIENIRLRKVCTIVTANPQPILDFIIKDMNRSATVEKAYGAYTHHELSVLVTVLTRRQALQLRNFLRENDPRSFITIVNSSEIIGKGFRSFN